MEAVRDETETPCLSEESLLLLSQTFTKPSEFVRKAAEKQQVMVLNELHSRTPEVWRENHPAGNILLC